MIAARKAHHTSHSCFSPAAGLRVDARTAGRKSNAKLIYVGLRCENVASRSRSETPSAHSRISALRCSATVRRTLRHKSTHQSSLFAVSPSAAKTPAALGAPIPGAFESVAGSLSGSEAIERNTSSIASGRSFRNVKYANTSAILAASGIQVSSLITAFIEGFVMRTVYEEKLAVASENARQIRQGAAKIVRPKFGAVAKLLWPHKTAACLAVIGKSNERTAARWLSGEFAPPISVVLAVNQEIFGDCE